MKKILLTAFLVAVLSCFFALSISAATFVSDYTSEVTKFYDTDGVTELMPDWVDLDDRDATAVIKKADGDCIRIPLYYIYQEKGTEFKQDVRDESNTGSTGFRYAWLSQQLGEDINHANLIALDIPHGTEKVNSLSSLTALEEVVFPTTATGFPKSENNKTLKKVFAKQTVGEDGTVLGITAISDYSFKNVNTLCSFGLELNYATYVGSNAFLNTAITEITLEGPFTFIGTGSFAGCKQLKSVSLNNTSDTIIGCGKQSFMGCVALESVSLNSFSLTEYSFEKISGGAELTFVATNVGKVEGYVFAASANLVSVDISGPITSVGNHVFSNCTNLASVRLYNTLSEPATCGNNICDGRTKLKSVSMHGISIGSYAFRNINGEDMTVTLTNVGYVGEGAFYRAGNITELYIEGAFEYIGASTYRECPKLKKLTVINTGDTRVTAGNGESNPVLEELYLCGKFEIKGSPVFQNNVSLKHVYLGEGVTELGPNSFYKCYALETMYLADTISVIGDRAIDMENVKNQTSESFMFVDENGNMDNTLPESLTHIGGHFLKCIKIANTQLIFPKSFTNHTSEQNYDFENTSYPEGFSIVYLGKMTAVNLHYLYQHNMSKEITVYLTQNTAADIKNYRITAKVSADGTISHGEYAGINPDGTLEIIIDERLHNNIKATEYIKFYFCGSDEVCFVTRVNILWGENTASSWGNFVSTPVTYAQLEAAYTKDGKTAPANHPLVSAPEYSDATCTVDGGIKTFCLGCGKVASIEKTSDAIGHNYDYVDSDEAVLLSIVYESYGKTGVKAISCGNCGEVGEFDAEALFVCLGYSACEFDESGISVGYMINRVAIAEYEDVNSATLEYGVFAVAGAKLEDGDVFNESGNAINGAVVVAVSESGNDMFEIKVVGFTSEAQKSAKIAMGAYVKKEGEISYLQAEEPNEGEKYNFVSYNDLVGR